ncbi:hypothetical protein BGX38DRAFT_629902 [Terfezia claveryi]|nr:hypothetical protein BGX38DRAFT_629902 [Terfezia claveryi]
MPLQPRSLVHSPKRHPRHTSGSFTALDIAVVVCSFHPHSSFSVSLSACARANGSGTHNLSRCSNVAMSLFANAMLNHHVVTSLPTLPCLYIGLGLCQLLLAVWYHEHKPETTTEELHMQGYICMNTWHMHGIHAYLQIWPQLWPHRFNHIISFLSLTVPTSQSTLTLPTMTYLARQLT